MDGKKGLVQNENSHRPFCDVIRPLMWKDRLRLKADTGEKKTQGTAKEKESEKLVKAAPVRG